MMARTFVFLAAAVGLAAQEDGAAFFEKNVRPLLARQCLGCHSATSQPVMGALRLDDRDLALKGGGRGASIVPGKPAESLLMKAVRHEADALKMPPGPKMKDADIAVLTQWIAMGAPWGKAIVSSAAAERFWAFVPPQKPAAPAVAAKAWVKSPIDAFVLAGLEGKGLKPAAPADKRALIRRATFDLTGLPPTPEEVRAYLADNSQDAFAKVIDRLLSSPRYGERWGRHWLDVARYADSNGLDENLVYKNAFRYRDYVIAAFNKDKPFNLFLKEQLAGDLLPDTGDVNTTFERWTATGFLSLGAKMLAEDDPMKMEMDIVDEQVDTTMRTFNALTVGCARCHDHKFDPIPHTDYYALAGIFKSSKTMEHFKVVAKWHEFVLAPKDDRDRLAAHEEKIEAKTREIGKITRAENLKITNAAKQRVGDYLLAASMVQTNAAIKLAAIENERGAILRGAAEFTRGNVPKSLEKRKPNVPKDVKGPYFAEYSIDVPAEGDYQVDILDEEKGAGTADLWLNGVWVRRGLPPVSNRAASPETGGWTALGVFRFKQGANALKLEHAGRFPYFTKLLIAKNTLSVTPRTDVQIAGEFGINPSILEQVVEYLDQSKGAASSVLFGWETQDWKLFPEAAGKRGKELAAVYTEVAKRAITEGKETKDPGMKAVYEFLTEKFGPFRAPGDARRYYTPELRASLAKLDGEQKALEAETPDFPRAMGVRESDKNDDLALHIRGSHWTLGDKVPRGFLRVIAGNQQPTIAKDTSGRLQLAEWLTQKDHPLTSRVMANRIWRWHFGRGIVPTVDNFGRLGEKPSNQALLDYLAVQFVESGWSMKQMHRTLMLSNSYQMSSTFDAKASEADPENIMLWRFPRRRLEAESIRDSIMAVSGDLDLQFSNGSILKYKDRQYVANTAKRGDVDYEKNVRAIFIPVVRSSMYDVFQAFDLPDPSTPNGDRDATVVAPQALFMMNGAVMLRHSLVMAKGLLARNDLDDAGRVRQAYERALNRPASGAEIDQALTFIAQMKQAWKGEDARAWQSFCKSLLSSNEFLYVN